MIIFFGCAGNSLVFSIFNSRNGSGYPTLITMSVLPDNNSPKGSWNNESIITAKKMYPIILAILFVGISDLGNVFLRSSLMGSFPAYVYSGFFGLGIGIVELKDLLEIGGFIFAG